MITMRVALIMGRFRQVCHYGSLVIRDVTKRSVLIENDYFEDCEDLPDEEWSWKLRL